MLSILAFAVLASPPDTLPVNQYHCPYNGGGRVWYPADAEDFSICPYCGNVVEWVPFSNNGNGNDNNVQLTHAKAEPEEPEDYIVDYRYETVTDITDWAVGYFKSLTGSNTKLTITVTECGTQTITKIAIWKSGKETIESVVTEAYQNDISDTFNVNGGNFGKKEGADVAVGAYTVHVRMSGNEVEECYIK